MRIIKMRASFGKLRETLELKPGMNLLTMPNEAGKSTWSAFLLAMLYGIDTSEQANAQNQRLPMKKRYLPWDGRAMEGSIELQWQGKSITIERTTDRRVPMGAFRAYETESGVPIPELTGENCGRMLCGVERSVFERTAFIRQLGLTVTEDAALEKRLSALVTTGEEGAKSYSQLETELKKYRNRLAGKAGKLPKLEAETQTLRNSLEELRAMQEETMGLTARLEGARNEKAALEEKQKQLALQKQERQWAGLKEMEENTARQEDLCKKLEETLTRLPGESDLYVLQRELESAQQNLQTAKMDAAMGVPEPKEPEAPPCFANLEGEAAAQKAKRDEDAYLQLRESKVNRLIPCLAAGLILLLCGIVLTVVGALPYNWIPLGLGAAVLTLWVILTNKKEKEREKRRVEAEKIASQYGIPVEKWRGLAESYGEALEAYARAQGEAGEQRRQLARQVTEAEAKLEELLRGIAVFAPEVKTVSDGRAAVNAALHAHSRLESEKRTLEQMRRQCSSVALMLGERTAPDGELPTEEIDEAKLNYEYRNVCQTLEDLSSRLASRRGAISMLGDPVSMEARLEELEEAASDVRRKTEAVDLALSALKTADDTLRARFSPQITADAGALLAKLTGGRYPAVLLAPDMSLSVRETEGTVMRPAAAMSCGTADQMYLALRLAMCRRLLPQEVPLVLDDALVNFDDTRAAAALELLGELAEKRQIIFFTCRKF